MMDPKTLAYDFDEERIGFGEPETPLAPHTPTRPPLATAGLALIGVGLLSLVIQSLGFALVASWPGFLSAYLLPTIGAILYFCASQKDTTPGIKHDGIFFSSLLSRGGLGWGAGIAMTAFYVLIYWYPQYLGHHGDAPPNGLVATVDPLSRALTGYPAGQWFLYGVLYTLFILIFGVRMAMKYRHNRYHLIRTASVFFSQFLLAWFLPNLLVRFQYPYLEFNGVWPLKQDYLWPSKVSHFFDPQYALIGKLLFVWAIGLVIATPILTYFYGKRWYCSWVCGCGGLAETLGDPWRQLSDKSTTSWHIERWMIHAVLVLVVVTTGVLWADHQWGWFGEWSGPLKQWYGFYIGAIFSGIVGVGFYPLLGSRVWCRFGCPQAAILGIFQRIFSRFRITTNGGQCMSCGNCSTYCEMGIDVRAYAQSGENIIRASCVGCGVCAAVCPRGVLRLENGLPGDRFEGAENPLGTLLAALEKPKIYRYESWDNKPLPSKDE